MGKWGTGKRGEMRSAGVFAMESISPIGVFSMECIYVFAVFLAEYIPRKKTQLCFCSASSFFPWNLPPRQVFFHGIYLLGTLFCMESISSAHFFCMESISRIGVFSFGLHRLSGSMWKKITPKTFPFRAQAVPNYEIWGAGWQPTTKRCTYQMFPSSMRNFHK